MRPMSEAAPTGSVAMADPEVEGPEDLAVERLEPEPPPRSLIGRVADYLTLVGIFMAPLYGKGIGGITGIAYADMVLGLAALARAAHLITVGFRLRTLKRHSFLLGMMTLFSLLGLISAFANRTNPLEWGFDRTVIATLGGVILVATHGDQEAGSRRQLLTAFGLGCIVLALSSFTGLKLQGRSLGWSVHPNALGHSCMMGIATAGWLWDNARRPLERWFWAGGVGLMVIGIMNSGSRGALLGLFVGGFMYLALRGNRRLTLSAIAGAFVIVMVLLVGIVHLPESNPLARLLTQGQSTSTATYSDQARSQLLKDDLARIDASPFFGDGFSDIVNVHVAYLQGWVAAGALAGLVSMIVGLAMLILPLLSRKRDLALACGAAAISVAWVFTNIFTARDQWLFLAIVFSTAGSITMLGPNRVESLAELDARP